MAEDDEVYEGTLEKVTSDGTKFIVKCDAIFSWYGVSARLQAVEKPDDVSIGDNIRFSITEYGGAPMISWAEKKESVKPAAVKRKSTETGPVDGEELYAGTIRAQSTKNTSMYLISCPCVTEWYGREPKASSEQLFLAGAGLGDEVTFTLEADDGVKNYQPVVAWMSRSDEVAKKKLKVEAAGAAKAKAKAACEAAVKASSGGAASELALLKEQLMQEKTARLEAQLEAEKTKNAMLSGGGSPVAAGPQTVTLMGSPKAGLPSDTEDDDDLGIKDILKKEKPNTGPPLIGKLKFQHADAAMSALTFYGTDLNGEDVKPEVDANDPSTIRVPGLAAGTTAKMLREHFAECGRLIDCAIVQLRSKNDAKGEGKTRDAKGKGKGKGKGDPKGKGKTQTSNGLDQTPAAKGASKNQSSKAGKGGKGAAKGAPNAGKGGPNAGKSNGASNGAATKASAVLVFASADAAESCLTLYGSEMAGHPGHELDIDLGSDGTSVNVKGLPADVKQAVVRSHFAGCGKITSLKIVPQNAK